MEVNAIWSDDGVALHLPDAESPPPIDDVLVDPDEVEELVVAEVGGTALFGARFRENAARALLIPRRRPGQRTPLWQQRLKAQSLLQVARRYADFPVVLETYRECLQDVFDLPALKGLLAALSQRRIDVVDVETPSASPFASSLLFDYVATYMYEDDTPLAERRAQALALDRDLLRELLGQEELRELLDEAAVDEVESQLRGDAAFARPAARPPAQARRPGARRVRRRARGAARGRAAGRARAGCRGGEAHRRRGRGPLPRRRRRHASGRSPRGVPRRRRGCSSRPPRPLRPRARALHDRRGRRGASGSTSGADGGRAGRPRARGPARARGAPAGRHGARVVRPRRSPPAAPREPRRASGARSSRPPRPLSAASCRGWHGIDRRASLREALIPLQGVALPVSLWEATCSRAACPATSPPGSTSSAPRVKRPGWARGSSGRRSTSASTPPRSAGPRRCRLRRARPHERIRARSASGALFWFDLVRDTGLDPEVALPALWDLVWAGEVTNDAWQPLARRPALPGSAAGAGPDGASRERGPTRSPRRRDAGRPPRPLFAGEPDPRALAELLLERHGIVTGDGVRAEGVPGGYAPVYQELRRLETLGVCRRGYFVEGLGGAQFALPGAVERLRERPGRGGGRRSRARRRRSRPAVRRGAPLAQARRRPRRARRRGLRRPPRRRGGALRRARRALARSAARAGGCLAATGARRARSSTCGARACGGSRSSASTASP